MKRHIFSTIRALTIVAIVLLFATMPVLAAIPNPGAVIPVPAGKYPTFSKEPHLSKNTWVENPNKVLSSIDLGYSGKVVAPIAGTLAIANDCVDSQLAVIRAPRGTDGYGWAIGLVHIYVYPSVRNTNVKQGQEIGYTVPPPATSKGCGYGSGSHIHYTLMKWHMNPSPRYIEQSIVNTYIGKWIIKNTYLDGPKYDIPLKGIIK